MFYHYKKNDEYITPEYAIYPILKYIRPHSKILCPFDLENSSYVKVFRENGHRVKYSHIETGKDFFDIKKTSADYIISNPPYSTITDVFKHLFMLDVSFAMLIKFPGIFESKRFYLFRDYGIEMLVLNKRIKFEDKEGVIGRPPFPSCYICHDILPEKIMYEEI